MPAALAISEVRPTKLFGLITTDATLVVSDDSGGRLLSARRHYGRGWKAAVEAAFGLSVADIQRGLQLGYAVVADGAGVTIRRRRGAHNFDTMAEAAVWLSFRIQSDVAW